MKIEGTPTQQGQNGLDVEVDTMQTTYKFHTAQFMRLFYEGSILFFVVLGLALTVALGAYGLGILSSIT